MKKGILFLILLFSSTVYANAQINPESHEVQFDYYSQTLEQWYNLTMNDYSYSISSSDPKYDGFISEVNYFNWHSFESWASDSGFFDLDIVDDNPNYILTFTRLEQSNTIALSQIPIADEIEPGWITMLNVVFEYQQKILAIDFNQSVWPIATQIFVMESYPEQYGISALFQRGTDSTRCCFSQNISLYVGVDFDFNRVEEWMENSTYSDSVYVEFFDQGTTTEVAFPSFFLRTGTPEEIEAYPLDRVTIMVIMDNGLSLLTSLDNGFNDFLYDSNIMNPTDYLHDYIPYIGFEDHSTSSFDRLIDTDNTPDFNLPLPFLSTIVGLTAINLIYKKKFG